MLIVLCGLAFMMTEQQKQLCLDYWSIVDTGGDYLSHVQHLSEKYGISVASMVKTVRLSAAFLDDVSCELCGMYCPLYLPADAPIMRAKKHWVCDHCLPVGMRENAFYPV